MSSGLWAGRGAGEHARRAGRDRRATGIRRAGGAALRDTGRRAFDPARLVRAVQDEVFPYDRNYFRTAETLEDSLTRLDRLWRDTAEAGPAAGEDRLRAREAAAMLATARWMYRSALVRRESRGMARRLDYPDQSAAWHRSVHAGGLDEVWTEAGESFGRPVREAAE